MTTFESNNARSIRILDGMQKKFRSEYGYDLPELTVNDSLRETKSVTSSWKKPYDFSRTPTGTLTIFIDSGSSDNHYWGHLLPLLTSPAKDSIEVLYLGHDGLTVEDDISMKTVMTGLPNLKEIHYCGYGAEYDPEPIIKECGLDIECHEIF